MLLVGAFSATGLVLSLVGIYGVLSFSIAQRRLEFGIRIALGAHRRDILKLVMKQGMILAGLGVGVGICAALISTKLQATVLYGTGHPRPNNICCSSDSVSRGSGVRELLTSKPRDESRST